MSGFEIAGVVLGGLPILVSALKLYIEGASTLKRWRFHARELKSLIRVLETEHAKLQNVCEKLLMGIVPEANIEAMINDPLGPAWQSREISAKLRMRLWRSFSIFEDDLRDMNEAMEELKGKMGMGPDGKIAWLESSVGRVLKGGALVLQRSEYNTLIARLRDGVSSLESLLNMNVDLETDRRRRSRGRLHNLVRDLAGGAYRALQSSLSCQCPGLHDVGLRLLDQTITVTPSDSDDDVRRMLRLGLAVSYASTALATSEQLWGSIRMWNRLYLQPTEPPKSAAPTEPAPTQRRGVSFSVSTTAVAINAPADATRGTRRVTSLCQELRKAPKLSADACCGHIADESRSPSPQYGVYPSADPGGGSDWCLVSLRDALTSRPPLLYGDKLHLAMLITSGVLQLQGTPWLPGNMTHNDVFLVKNGGIVLYREVFVQRRFPEPGPELTTQQPGSTCPTSFALGMLLIEVVLGQAQPEASMETPGHPLGHLASYAAATQLLGQVNMHGGPNYCSAVDLCIRGGSHLGSNGSGDVVSRVLGLLEKDLEMAVA